MKQRRVGLSLEVVAFSSSIISSRDSSEVRGDGRLDCRAVSRSRFMFASLLSSVLKSSNIILSVRHLKIKASFQYGLILYSVQKSAVFLSYQMG